MYDKLKAILVEELSVNPDDIRLDAELENDLGINSLELADLVFLCEEKFSIQIDDDDIKGLITVGDVVKYLEENAANAYLSDYKQKSCFPWKTRFFYFLAWMKNSVISSLCCPRSSSAATCGNFSTR